MKVDEFIAERVGQVVGDRWVLDRVLGAGGMAAVYAAHDSAGRVAAVKILHPEMCVRRDVRERFLREGVAANRIEHPGAVAVYEQGAGGDDSAYLVMELLAGETLGERLQRHGTLPVPQVLDVMDQVLDVLAMAHDRGIVHRDLKPDNLFITSDERIKVLDFGLARLLDSVPGEFKTRTGAALGTFPYMAPEQALGRRSEIDGRADLFSLGATAFRILAQRKVHEADSDAELLMAMASKAAPPLRVVAPHVPEPVARVVDVSLAFAKEARYPDARTMQNDVRAARVGQPPPFASARQVAQGAPTSVGVPRSGVSPTIPDDSGAEAGRHPVPTGVTEPLGTPTGAAQGATYVPASLPAPSATVSSEPTAPLSGPVGSLLPLSGSASGANPPSSRVEEGRGRRRSAAALLVGLAAASVLGVALVAGGAVLLWWWGSGVNGAATAGQAEPEVEGASIAAPRLAEGPGVAEAAAEPDGGAGVVSSLPGESKKAKKADPAPAGSSSAGVSAAASVSGKKTGPEAEEAGVPTGSDAEESGPEEGSTSSGPSSASAAPAPPPSRATKPRHKPHGSGRGRRKKDDG